MCVSLSVCVSLSLRGKEIERGGGREMGGRREGGRGGGERERLRVGRWVGEGAGLIVVTLY